MCTIEYFLDTLQQWELNTIVDNIKYLDRTEKEIDRYKLYVNIQANSKKKLKPEDILPLVWDKENDELKDTSISNEDVARLNEKAKRIAENFKNIVQ